ncbi:MAG: hypothetical protein LBB07_02765, partial [Bifidobacteriaceae bacterium]|nr:hypothetical protein [Bifidobacteriaceae bacterium]
YSVLFQDTYDVAQTQIAKEIYQANDMAKPSVYNYRLGEWFVPYVFNSLAYQGADTDISSDIASLFCGSEYRQKPNTCFDNNGKYVKYPGLYYNPMMTLQNNFSPHIYSDNDVKYPYTSDYYSDSQWIYMEPSTWISDDEGFRNVKLRDTTQQKTFYDKVVVKTEDLKKLVTQTKFEEGADKAATPTLDEVLEDAGFSFAHLDYSVNTLKTYDSSTARRYELGGFASQCPDYFALGGVKSGKCTKYNNAAMAGSVHFKGIESYNPGEFAGSLDSDNTDKYKSLGWITRDSNWYNYQSTDDKTHGTSWKKDCINWDPNINYNAACPMSDAFRFHKKDGVIYSNLADQRVKAFDSNVNVITTSIGSDLRGWSEDTSINQAQKDALTSNPDNYKGVLLSRIHTSETANDTTTTLGAGVQEEDKKCFLQVGENSVKWTNNKDKCYEYFSDQTVNWIEYRDEAQVPNIDVKALDVTDVAEITQKVKDANTKTYESKYTINTADVDKYIKAFKNRVNDFHCMHQADVNLCAVQETEWYDFHDADQEYLASIRYLASNPLIYPWKDGLINITYEPHINSYKNLLRTTLANSGLAIKSDTKYMTNYFSDLKANATADANPTLNKLSVGFDDEYVYYTNDKTASNLYFSADRLVGADSTNADVTTLTLQFFVKTDKDSNYSQSPVMNYMNPDGSNMGNFGNRFYTWANAATNKFYSGKVKLCVYSYKSSQTVCNTQDATSLETPRIDRLSSGFYVFKRFGVAVPDSQADGTITLQAVTYTGVMRSILSSAVITPYVKYSSDPDVPSSWVKLTDYKKNLTSCGYEEYMLNEYGRGEVPELIFNTNEFMTIGGLNMNRRYDVKVELCAKDSNGKERCAFNEHLNDWNQGNVRPKHDSSSVQDSQVH